MEGISPLNRNISRPKLLDEVRQSIRVRHYSIRTEEAYLNWIKRFISCYHVINLGLQNGMKVA